MNKKIQGSKRKKKGVYFEWLKLLNRVLDDELNDVKILMTLYL